MNVIRNDWWVTPIWEVETEFDKKFNDNLLLEMKSFYRNNNSNHSIKRDEDEPNIWSLKTPCIEEINQYIIKVVTDLTHDYVAHNYNEYEWLHTKGWGNYIIPGQSIPLHAHPGSKISATYYIQTEDNCGDILLVDPRGGVDWDKQIDGKTNGTKFKRITPKPSKLIFFPSYVLHSVDTNKSKDLRISLTTDMQTFSSSLLKQFIESLGT